MTQMQKYYADFEGCDGSRGSAGPTEAANLQAARDYFWDRWPDARHIDVYSHETYLERERERYHRANRQYEDQYDYDYED